MTEKKKHIIKLSSSVFVLVLGIVLCVIACVSAVKKYEGIEYSHNIKIENIRTIPVETPDEVMYSYITLSGSVRNCKDDVVDLHIYLVFEGIENKTGEKTEYRTGLYLGEVNPNQEVVLKSDEVVVGNDKSFIPEKLKRVEVVTGDSATNYRAKFVEDSGMDIVLFGASLVCLLASTICGTKFVIDFVRFIKEDKK